MMRALLFAFLLAALSAGLLAALPAHAQEPASKEPPATACVGDSTTAQPEGQAAVTAFARADVKAIAEKLTCYCGCPHLQVSKCFCGTADQIREWIAVRIDQGMTPDAIMAAYVEEHGTWILAEPPKRGFNWIIWIGPAALVILGTFALVLIGKRWSAPRPATTAPAIDTATEARLRAELERALESER